MPANQELRTTIARLATDVMPASHELRKQMAQAVASFMRDADRYESPDEFGAAIEQTAPKVAEQVRSLRTRDEVVSYLNLLVVILELMLVLWGMWDKRHDAPDPGQTTNQVVINIDTTNVTNMPAATTGDYLSGPKP